MTKVFIHKKFYCSNIFCNVVSQSLCYCLSLFIGFYKQTSFVHHGINYGCKSFMIHAQGHFLSFLLHSILLSYTKDTELHSFVINLHFLKFRKGILMQFKLSQVLYIQDQNLADTKHKGHFQNATFSTQLMNRPVKLDCYIMQSWKGLQGTDSGYYWAHL